MDTTSDPRDPRGPHDPNAPRYLEVHQSRTHEPTPYEYRLAATLEEVFTTVGHDLASVVSGLNARQVHAPDGNPWTEQTFRDEMHRLGA